MSTKGEFEFLLPPGQVTIHAYGWDVSWSERWIEIKADDRELFLGTFDVPPSLDATGNLSGTSAGATKAGHRRR